VKIHFLLNGEPIYTEVAAGDALLDVLRSQGISSVRSGCETGDCGSCTVLLDGRPVRGCLTFAAKAQGREVTTVEALGTPEKLHPIQEALVEAGGVQCGYCTPGMVLTAYALLAKVPEPTADEVREALAGNLCRCTGYAKIVEGVLLAAAWRREGRWT